MFMYPDRRHLLAPASRCNSPPRPVDTEMMKVFLLMEKKKRRAQEKYSSGDRDVWSNTERRLMDLLPFYHWPT